MPLDSTRTRDFANPFMDLANECTPDDLRDLAGEVHAAATFIDPARQPTATAEITADREAE